MMNSQARYSYAIQALYEKKERLISDGADEKAILECSEVIQWLFESKEIGRVLMNCDCQPKFEVRRGHKSD